jgi:hypothetical protein
MDVSGWDWSQPVTIVAVVLAAGAVMFVGRFVAKLVFAALALFLTVYFAQSMGWVDWLPFACHTPQEIMQIVITGIDKAGDLAGRV